ncbi:ABC transporter substrate-binding protein [Paenibacillus sp. sgz302251]|uniref:ABC transporter substrate-binding protein n=1 Tax=Paenibacillus sp. sgz302251 TaxID=3414493 RepID=UPI003C7E0757
MKKHINKWTLTIILIAIFTLLAACGSTGSNTETSSGSDAGTASNNEEEFVEVPIVGVRDAQISSQLIIADKMGFFTEQGLKPAIKLIESGPDINGMIAGGSAPISFTGNQPAAILSSNGIDVKVVTPLAQIAGTQAIVGGKNLKLTSAKDLEGKTIGIPSGADVIMAIQKMAKELNVDFSKIKFVNLAPSDAVVALERGDIDAMACWEPFVTKAINQGGSFLFSGTKSELPGKQGDVDWMSVHSAMLVTGDYLDKNAETVKKLITGLKKATDYINNNREEAIKVLAPELHVTEAELTEIMNRNAYSMEVDESYINGSNGKEVMDYFLEIGNIKKVPAYDNYNDFSLLKEVEPSLVKN